MAADTPVIRVKQVLATTINEPTGSQRLIFKGKALAGMSILCSLYIYIRMLTDDKPLKFYNITSGSKLNLVVKHAAPSTGGTAAPSTSSTSSPAPAPSSSTTATTSTAAKQDISLKKGQFQLLLQQFLQQHYTPEDVAKLMEQVNKVSCVVVLVMNCILIHHRVYTT